MGEDILNVLFRKNEDETYSDTEEIIRFRVSELFGFNQDEIVPFESSSEGIEVHGKRCFITTRLDFSVKGFGYTTDFKNIWRNDAYDDPKIYNRNHPKED